MMVWLYVAAAVISSGLASTFYKVAADRTVGKRASMAAPCFWYLPLAAVFGCVSLINDEWGSLSAVLPPALLAGAAAAVCAVALLFSMRRSSYAFTVILVNCSFLFPILLSCLLLHEQTGWWQLLGMVIAVTAIVVLFAAPAKGRTPPLTVLITLAASLGNGLIDFAIKWQQYRTPGASENLFFFLNYLFAALLCGIAGLLTKDDRPRKPSGTGKKNGPNIRFLLGALGIAACNGICFFCISRSAAALNAAAQFVIITALSIILSLAVGCVRFKARLGTREWLGLLACAAAIAFQFLNL